MNLDVHAPTFGDPAAPPLVLLHAFPVHSGMWRAQAEALSDTHFVVTPDQRGFGGTPLAGEPSLDSVADDVVALLDRLGLERVALGGLSMGGYVTMALLRRHPERVGALILADTRMNADTDEGRANRLRVAETVETENSVRLLLEQALPSLVGTTTLAGRPDVMEGLRGMVAGASPRAVAWAQRAMAARPDSRSTLARVSVPTLVIGGEEDVLSPPEAVAAMAATIPGASTVVIPAAGHLTAMETPEAVTEAIGGFLATLT